MKMKQEINLPLDNKQEWQKDLCMTNVTVLRAFTAVSFSACSLPPRKKC